MDASQRTRIAARFLPSRWHYHYARSKLGSDPLYAGVSDALRGSNVPLLDIGCGIGLLAHALHADGLELPYVGVDNDAGKIAQAQAAATRGDLPAVQFQAVDATAGLPPHQGSVCILDVLQFLPPAAQAPLLAVAAERIAATGRLVIRTGLADGNWRSHVTRGVDVLSRALRWMNAGPTRYPTRDGLTAQLAALGLSARFSPLWGNTPFNNWLVIAEPATAGTGSTVR